jgi:hypothetical protein
MPGRNLFSLHQRHRRQDLHPDHSGQFRGRRQRFAASLPCRDKLGRYRKSGERLHQQLQCRLCAGRRQLRSIGWFLQDRDWQLHGMPGGQFLHRR